MALVEVLTLQLGAAIAKSIFRLWIQDPAWAESTTSGLIDIINSKTQDITARQRGRRQLEEIGEKVALSLKPVLEAEQGLAETTLEAIVFAVAQVLDKSRLDVALLLKTNLEPTLLANFMLSNTGNSTIGFSLSEKVLFERIVRQTCQYIVDIAASLPTFNERSISEVLKREDAIKQKADQILEEIKLIRERASQSNDAVESASFEADYRLSVVRSLDEIYLFGVDLPSIRRGYHLSVAYVNLTVTARFFLDDEEFEDSDEDEDYNGITGLSLEEVLSKSNRILIKGQAGSGKTTLLQWIAVRSATQSFEGALTEWNDTIPFFIRLRQFVGKELPQPQDFPRYTVDILSSRVPDNWMPGHLKEGRAVILVDGVDEIPSQMRKKVYTWVRSLVKTYPKARYIVSSRPHAINEGWLSDLEFDEAALEPMELGHIQTFIEHWHTAVCQNLRSETQKADTKQIGDRLRG